MNDSTVLVRTTERRPRTWLPTENPTTYNRANQAAKTSAPAAAIDGTVNPPRASETTPANAGPTI